jgi:hypothetical protein
LPYTNRVNALRLNIPAAATISGEGARSVQEGDLHVGDIVRWADSNNNPKHFAGFIFRGDDGVPVVFGKSGKGGPYELGTPASITAKYSPLYGAVRGINTGETGFYHPR